MKIAFHAPLKSPDHPVPSGDRLMARLLLAALRQAGHTVEVASQLRVFMSNADDTAAAGTLHDAARQEAARLDTLWRAERPDLWFCYHPYYKSPDLIGPALCRQHGVAYVTAECSLSRRRNQGVWAGNQRLVLEGARQAALNICLTRRDRDGLLDACPDLSVAMLPPFIAGDAFLETSPDPQPFRLATVAMMRSGDKLQSYAMLAQALARLPENMPWHISIVGDGPARDEVRALFSGLESGRITWHGECERAEIAAILASASLYVWPGYGEAYGLAYLEAQAAGLPVVAQDIAGVPEVVHDGETGLLTPPGDVAALAQAIERLLCNNALRQELALQARTVAGSERTLEAAAARLSTLLETHVKAAS